MSVKYGKFQLPSDIKVDESVSKRNYCRFVAEPFEKGFGHTVGNALRRILLSAIEAPAVVSLCIEGVLHEYMAIEGVIEDMTHIVLNFKTALLRKLSTEEKNGSRQLFVFSEILDVTGEMLDKHGGAYPVTAGYLLGNLGFEVIEPDHLLFTVTKPMVKKIDLKIGVGRGYVPSERHVIREKLINEIVIDSAFSPVRLVNYYVENTRVGQDTDLDRLILEITTDGRISPKEALGFAAYIAGHHLGVFCLLGPDGITFDAEREKTDTNLEELLAKLALKINEIELTVRSTNCLSGAKIEIIGELVLMLESDMLEFRNFGRKSLYEIKAKLAEMGLSLGMDLSRFGITRDNIKAVISEYVAKKENGNQV